MYNIYVHFIVCAAGKMQQNGGITMINEFKVGKQIKLLRKERKMSGEKFAIKGWLIYQPPWCII